jgi:membrane protein DedA with SNARE-associated domain
MEDWIVQLVLSLGVFGVALLMFGENVFPPLPSEFIMPLAGFLAATGEISLAGAIVAGALGSLLGAAAWYVLARRITLARLERLVRAHGPWLAMRPEDLGRAIEFFRRYGRRSVCLGRLVPVARTLISVPAGFSGMPVALFLFYSLLGTAIWTAALACAGWLLGMQFPRISQFLGPITWAVVAIGLGWYAWRVVRLKREQHARQRAAA